MTVQLPPVDPALVETASALDISESTVERHWRGARAWLDLSRRLRVS